MVGDAGTLNGVGPSKRSLADCTQLIVKFCRASSPDAPSAPTRVGSTRLRDTASYVGITEIVLLPFEAFLPQAVLLSGNLDAPGGLMFPLTRLPLTLSL